MAAAEWNGSRPSPISVIQQFDYYGKMTAQFPLSPLRVVYAASGTIPAACILRESPTVIEHKLYWSSVEEEREALYLVAILHSETARSHTAQLQSSGQWGARDFDKVIFTLPIPRFDRTNSLHNELAALGREAEKIASTVSPPPNAKFQRARKSVRDALKEQGVAARIEALVEQLLGN